MRCGGDEVKRAAILLWIASCATTEAASPGADPSPVPEGGVPDSGAPDVAAPVDGGCDAASPDCVTKPVTCDEAAWCPVPTNVTSLYALTAVWGSSKNDIWTSGSGGTMLHWDGASWKPSTLPSDTALPIRNTFHTLWGSGPTDVWAASSTDVIFHFDGTKWQRAPNAIENYSAPIYAVWGLGELRFGGGSFTLFQPNGNIDTGNQIIKQGDGWAGVVGTATVHGFWGTTPDDLWLVGDNSRVHEWQVGLTMHGTRGDGGDFVWTEVDSRAAVVLLAIWGSSASDIWAVGEKGTIRHHGAGYGEWELVASPTTETLHAVWGSASNDVWAVGETGTILHWDGAAWKPSLAAFPVNKTKPHLYGVWGSGPSDVWIVGDGIALHYTGGAK